MIEPTIPIAIADDHIMMREAIRNMLASYYGFYVVIEADNGKELIERLDSAVVFPEICILDIQMPVMNGFETIVELKKHWPKLKILVLSMFNHEFNIIKMLKLGAGGYVLKGSSLEELHKALRGIYNHGYYSSELVASNFFHMIQSDNPLYNITDKEIEFLKYCSTDLSYREIGKILGLSTRTIEGYRNSLFQKLNLSSRVGLAMFAINIGLVPYENKS